MHRLLRATVDAYDDPPRVLAGEVNLDPDELAAYYGAGDELHLPPNFHTIVDLPWTSTDVAGLVGQVEAATADFAWPSCGQRRPMPTPCWRW